MILKKIGRLLIAGLVATQATFLVAEASMAQSVRLASFQCTRTEGFFVTRAVSKNGSVSAPMIAWTSQDILGRGDTSEQRCNEVTNKLNDLLQENDGTLSGLYMTVGRVNGRDVVCFVNNTNSGCNRNNVLFALKGETRAEPARVLANVLGLDIVVDLILIGNLLQDFSPLPMQISSG